MAEKVGVSFSFAKTKESVSLKQSIISDREHTTEHDTEYLTALIGNQIQSTRPKEQKKKELVIPLITKNKWKIPKRPEDLDQDDKVPEKKKRKIIDATDKTNDVENAAINEILQEAAAESDRWDNRGTESTSDIAVPLLLQNKVPDGYETDDRLNVELRPAEPEEANYDEIPIEEYGMALLRGMGFKDGQGIGKNSKVFKPIDAVARPRGLGLGADRSKLVQAKHNSNQSLDNQTEQLVLKKGAFAVITSGKNSDLYGEVQGVDEDNNRVMLKMTLNVDIISISQNAIKLVTKSEYNKYSKYINKGKTDKFNEEDNCKSKHREESSSHKHKHYKHRSASRDRDSDTNKDPIRDSHRDSDRKHKSKSGGDRRENGDSETKGRNRKQLRPQDIWLRSNLRVRIIDSDLKKGKYFKSKVIIEDVVGFNNCVVKTDEGKILEDINQSQLETVIPRSDPAYVMLLSGQYKTSVAEILRKDKSACVATVQLLSDRHIVMETHYDTICEYTGDVSTELDF